MCPVRPLVGVGAVVWDGERVLLERRGQPPGQGSWALPGGLIDVGESAAAAVQREVREECGIEVKVGPVSGLFEPIQTRDPSTGKAAGPPIYCQRRQTCSRASTLPRPLSAIAVSA